MKFDVSKIEGYADMTPEQKVAALEGMDFQMDSNGNGEATVSKTIFDKTASDLAAAKKNSTAQDKKIGDLEKEVAALKRTGNIGARTADFLGCGLGISAEEATKAATALVDNDATTMFGVLRNAASAAIAQGKKDQAASVSRPPVGGVAPSDTNYDEELRKAQEAGNSVRVIQLENEKAQRKS